MEDTKKQKSRGFTLIEVLAAAFLVTIIFIGIFGGFHVAMKTTEQSRAKTTALYFASEKIEKIKNLAYEQIVSFDESITRDGINYSIEVIMLY